MLRDVFGWISNSIVRKKFRLILFLMLMSVVSLQAQESRLLSLEESIKLGLENSKTLKVSNSKIEASKAKLSEVEAGGLPSVKLNAYYTRLSEVQAYKMQVNYNPNDPVQKAIAGMFSGMSDLFPVILNNYGTKISLSQPLFTGFRQSGLTDVNENLMKASQYDYSKDKDQLVYDIKNAYWSYFRGLELIKSLEKSIEQMQTHLDDMNNMAKSGLATDNDVLKVKVQLSNLQYTKLDAESNLQLGLMGFNNLIGLPITTKVFLKDTIEEKSVEIPDLNYIKTAALNNRDELKAMEYRIKAGESGVKVAQSVWYPQVFVGANYTYSNPNQRIMPSKAEFNGTWDLGITFSYDLWNWGTASYQSAQAQENFEQAKLGYVQMKEGIELDVAQSYLNIVKAKEKLPVARQGIEQAEENYRVTNEKFKSGLATNTDVLDAETALITARINYTTALVDIELAKAKLEKAIGK